MTVIRAEQSGDIAAIRQLNLLTFDGNTEANIVDALRDNCDELLSLVADQDGEVVGHILFSPLRIETKHGTVHGMGLAPMAVLPEFLNRGIGSQLVERGLDELRQRGVSFVIVLGHPDYYPRFGFVHASQQGIKCQWEGVTDEAFMVLLLDELLDGQLAGSAYYREEFDL
jgi:putative acetyltransferase